MIGIVSIVYGTVCLSVITISLCVILTYPGFFFSPLGPKLSPIKTQFLAKAQIKKFLKLSFSENESKKISSVPNEIFDRLNIDVFINFKPQNLVKLNSDL